jgi:hypothetical protein
MFKKRRKMRFLSESILLEESGLPKINSVIAVVVSVIIIMFLIWSNQLIIEESISIKGQVIVIEASDNIEFIGLVRTSDLVAINFGADTYIDIPGITKRQGLNGIVNKINTQPQFDSNNVAYYEIYVALNESDKTIGELNNTLIAGMDSELRIVTGSRTMLQFLLGTLYDTGKDAFDIK